MAGPVPVTQALNEIYTADTLAAQAPRWDHLVRSFTTTYGHPPAFVSRSPGRVNIIGEHIDYSLYSVLPMAITADALFAVSAASSDSNTIRIGNVKPDKYPSQEFEITNQIEIDATVHEWTNYFKAGLRGALELLQKNDPTYTPKSMQVMMDGTVPAGGGLSSSAAFVSAAALAVLYANGVEQVDKTQLTELAIVSERAVGVNSGGMDQSASVLSLRGSALFVSFDPSLVARPVQFPKTDPELSFVIAQSFVTSNKQVTGPICYNLRVVECSMAAAYLHASLNKSAGPLPADAGPLGISLRGFHNAYFASSDAPFLAQLRELVSLTETTLTQVEGYTREEVAAVLGMTVDQLNARFTSKIPVRATHFKLRQRALHVLTEAIRVLEFLDLLENPSESLGHDAGSRTAAYNQRLGDLMNATQDSCRDAYECSCPEIDELCSIARAAGSYGSRLTGAGWGGCSVHLVPTDKVDAVKQAWNDRYYSNLDLTEEQKAAAVVVSKPGSGSAIYLV